MSTKVKGTIFALTGGVCWGLSGVVGKLLFDERGLNAQWLVTSRLLFGGLIMLLAAFYTGGKKVFDIWRERRAAGSLLFFSLFGMMLCQLSYFLCIQYSNPATATVLQYTSPVLIMLLCLAKERELPKFMDVVVLVIVMAGVFLMATHGNIHSLALSKEAMLSGAVAALAVVFYNIWPVRLLKTYGAAPVVGWGMFVGGILLFPFSKFWEIPGTWDGYTVLFTFLVIFVGTVCSFGCYLKGVMYLGPMKSSLFACVEPLVSAILTASVLHEKFQTADIVGMAAIVIGVTALAASDRKRKENDAVRFE